MFRCAFLRNARWQPWLLLLAVALLVLALEGVAAACPTCKDTLAANDPHRANLVRGYGYSIIFMLSMPFVIFSSLCGYFYYLVVKDRRQKARQALSAAPELVAAR
ncbi:MAG TPA: hypothetical protein VL096_19480 [Pirellulaceae bacterium]|nr:hypothetical protein [Pirellulaceae bacterium]